MRRLLLLASLLACAHAEPAVKTLEIGELHARESYDLAAARAAPNPAGVSFALDGGPVRRGAVIELAGWLENGADEPRTVIVFPAGPHGFHLGPAPGNGTRRPPGPGEPPRPPPAPPPPETFVLPARSRVRLVTALVAADYDWPPGPLELEWSFLFWNEPKPRGRVRVE